MAKITENFSKRRIIKLSTNDVISIVREYMNLSRGIREYEGLRKKLDDFEFYIPED